MKWGNGRWPILIFGDTKSRRIDFRIAWDQACGLKGRIVNELLAAVGTNRMNAAEFGYKAVDVGDVWGSHGGVKGALPKGVGGGVG